MQKQLNTERAYSTKELCSIFQIHKSTVRRWVIDGTLPAPIKLGRSTRFLKSEIDQIIQAKKDERVI
ncbi:helix-turn-helix transcriptional regulator [Marinicella rhabdoformis]|uniref:helix-turn-helix transcriptional regulator n=1 Tax=Marinicella rhabdoformis TaxID=2580566 RepID=UPI0012AED4C1|nr:helix-turn-helix domain-containing protein [Marinicella rhabdoformis]